MPGTWASADVGHPGALRWVTHAGGCAVEPHPTAARTPQCAPQDVPACTLASSLDARDREQRGRYSGVRCCQPTQRYVQL